MLLFFDENFQVAYENYREHNEQSYVQSDNFQ